MLKIVGAGEEEEYLKYGIKIWRIESTLWVAKRRLIKLMQMSECFIMVSKNEHLD